MGTHLSPAFYGHWLLLGPLCALINQNHVDIRLDFFKWVCFFWDLNGNLYFCLVLYLLQIPRSWKLSTPWRKCSFDNDGCVPKAMPKGKGGLTGGTAMTRTAHQARAAAWIVKWTVLTQQCYVTRDPVKCFWISGTATMFVFHTKSTHLYFRSACSFFHHYGT